MRRFEYFLPKDVFLLQEISSEAMHSICTLINWCDLNTVLKVKEVLLTKSQNQRYRRKQSFSRVERILLKITIPFNVTPIYFSLLCCLKYFFDRLNFDLVRSQNFSMLIEGLWAAKANGNLGGYLLEIFAIFQRKYANSF